MQLNAGVYGNKETMVFSPLFLSGDYFYGPTAAAAGYIFIKGGIKYVVIKM